MVLAMLRCSVVGKWTGGAVEAEKGKLIGNYRVWEESSIGVSRVSGIAEADWKAQHSQ